MQYPNGVICEQVAPVRKMKGEQGCCCQSDLWHDTRVSQCLKEWGMRLRNCWLRHHWHTKRGSAGKEKQPFVNPILSNPLSDEAFAHSNNQGIVQLSICGVGWWGLGGWCWFCMWFVCFMCFLCFLSPPTLAQKSTGNHWLQPGNQITGPLYARSRLNNNVAELTHSWQIPLFFLLGSFKGGDKHCGPFWP